MIAGLVATLASGATAVAQTADEDFAACGERFLKAPAERASALCFYRVAQKHDRWIEADRRLTEWRADHPDRHWLTLMHAYVEARRGEPTVEALLREAAAGFSAAADVAGELSARANLNSMFMREGRGHEATREAERVGQLGAQTDDPMLKVRAWTSYGFHLGFFLNDLRGAYRMLMRARAVELDAWPYSTEFRLLNALGAVSHQLGHLHEARARLRQAEQLAHANDDPRGALYVRVEAADVLLDEVAMLPAPDALKAARTYVAQTLADTLRTGHQDLEIRSRWQLAALRGATADARAAARDHLERCVALAETLRSAAEQAACASRLAVLLAETDAVQARRLMAQAMSVAHSEDNARRIAETWRAGAALAWTLDPPDKASKVALAGLGAIEVIRNLQPPGAGRITAFSIWTQDFYRLAGRLLRVDGAENRQTAFAVMERMRARALLEAVNASSVPPTNDALTKLESARAAALTEIARIQRQKLDPSTNAPTRAALDRALAAQERHAEALRDELWRRVRPAIRPTVFATPTDVQNTLEADEAMLVFQLGLDTDREGGFGGGSWLWVLTRSQAKLHPLPDRLALAPKIPMLLGLFPRRDASVDVPSYSLYRDLLADAVASLPASVAHLVIVADGQLHRVPFAGLPMSTEGDPIAARFTVSTVPSATFWLAQRRAADDTRTTTAAPALAIVDPTPLPAVDGFEDETGVDAEPTTASQRRIADRGRLPFAQLEGRALVARLGGASLLLAGPRATEAAVKQALQTPYRIVHWATHAETHETRPERSAIILAAGAEQEDGLLQAREIIEQPFKDRIIVVASCRSAGGGLSRGEGILSLSRAFLAAGARTVVGARWRLRDDDAERFFDAFYAGLSRGQDVRSAVQTAQQRAIAQGRPAAAWAGVVILGDGTVTPFPNGSPQRRATILVALLGAALLGLGLAVIVFRGYPSRRASISRP